MFYVTSATYIGPNPDQNSDADTYEISTTPSSTNSSHEVCINGWLGSDGDFSHSAHGEFETEEEAREWIEDNVGECREGDREYEMDYSIGDYGENWTITFRVGAAEMLCPSDSIDWCADDFNKIDAQTTDAEIDQMVEECEGAAQDAQEQGVDPWCLDLTAIRSAMLKHRDEMIEEEGDAAA